MFGLFGYTDFYGGSDCWDGPDRRNWADKSEAAIRRENQAKAIFDAFLKQVDQETSAFPYSKEIIPPTVHLTSACYTSFRKYVLAKGCKCVRREATYEEKMALSKSERRNSKMYFVKITVPTSPSNLLQAKAEQERKAQEAKAKKQANAEKKRKLEQERAEQERKVEKELTERTLKEYALAEAHVTGETTTTDATTVVDKENISNQQQQQPKEGSPTKRLKTGHSLVITVPLDRILKLHHSKALRAEHKVRKELAEQKYDEMEQMKREIQAKYDQLEQEEVAKTKAQLDLVKNAIIGATSIAKEANTTTASAAETTTAAVAATTN